LTQVVDLAADLGERDALVVSAIDVEAQYVLFQLEGTVDTV
jgi:hypothetical protein